MIIKESLKIFDHFIEEKDMQTFILIYKSLNYNKFKNSPLLFEFSKMPIPNPAIYELVELGIKKGSIIQINTTSKEDIRKSLNDIFNKLTKN